jgi:hypothetical protein
MPEHRNAGTPEYHFHFEGKFKMKFVCIGILQQPIGTLQIPSRDLQRAFQICKANEEIANELRSQKRNASRSLGLIALLVFKLK